ncbi:MAG: CRP/FNR family transcriptional regulator, partial [Arenicella sp.]
MKTHKHAISLKTVTDACDLCHAKDICVSSLLDPESLKHFKDIVHHKSPMERGERLFMAGDSIHSIFILHSGSVKSYLESNAGDNQITGFHLPGDVVGIHGLEKKCHADTVEALETSCVCEIRFSNFDEVGDTFPALQKKLARNILLQMDHDQEMMMILGKMSAERRVAYFLLDMAKRLKGHGLS